DSEPDIAARIVFEIVSGEATGERDLERAEIHADETAAAPGIIFLVAERTALQSQRQFGPNAKAHADETEIFLEGGAVGCVGGEKPPIGHVVPNLGKQLETDLGALDAVIGIAGNDVLVF